MTSFSTRSFFWNKYRILTSPSSVSRSILRHRRPFFPRSSSSGRRKKDTEVGGSVHLHIGNRQCDLGWVFVGWFYWTLGLISIVFQFHQLLISIDYTMWGQAANSQCGLYFPLWLLFAIDDNLRMKILVCMPKSGLHPHHPNTADCPRWFQRCC